MSEIEFVKELPSRTAGARGERQDVVEKLRANPGAWAAVARYPEQHRTRAYTCASNYKRGFEGVEATTRTVDGETVVYARAVAS